MSSTVDDEENNNKAGCIMPLDMWREVLVRLPGECLIGIRAVCKGFRAVIDDPGFVRSHTENWSSSSSNVVIRNYASTAPSKAGTCYSLDLEGLGLSNGHQAIAATPLELDFLSNSPGARFPWPVAACNGLVLTQNRNLFTMWNPLTRERLELPPTAAGGLYAPAFGLGYDHATDDYKAVVVLRDLQTHVCSLRSDTWRRIAADCPLAPDDGPGVFAGGLLNWLSSSGDDKIVSLDLGTEKYSLLQMPPKTRMPNKKSKCKWLNVLGGCLVVCDTASYGYLDVWVLKKDSWIKLFSVDAAADDEGKKKKLDWYGYLRPVAFVMKKKDERLLVFLQDAYKGFFLFDLETLKCVGIHEQRKGRVNWDAQQMFVGTMFRLHANCGTRTDTTNKKRKITSCCSDTTNEKKKKKRRITSCCCTDTTNKKRKLTSCCCCTDTTNEKKTNKRRKTSCCTMKKKSDEDCTKKKNKKPAGLVFCVRDANGKSFGHCSEPEDGRYDVSRYQQRVLKETEGFDFPKPGVNWGTRVPANDNGEPVRFAILALDKYNQRNKTAFVFDRVVFATFTPSGFRTYYITFRIKNNGENYGPDVFHARVWDRRWRVIVKLVRPRRS